MFLAAVVQLTCTSDEVANWRAVKELVERAASHGAQLIATPENTDLLATPDEKLASAQTLQGPLCLRFSDLAGRLGVHLLLGSFSEKTDDPRRVHNTSVLFGPDGGQLSVYRKIHLFDVDLSETVRFTESMYVRPGESLALATTELGPIGLSICYDLRFASLYRALVERGAKILLVPSAFTMTTGKDHWMPLLRARAIETQSYVVAPAQFGVHDDRGIRESYGHSMIVDPWGHVIAQASDGPGLALAEIDLHRVDRLRSAMRVLDWDRVGNKPERF